MSFPAVFLGCGKQSEEPAWDSDHHFPPALASPGHQAVLPGKLGSENTTGKELTTKPSQNLSWERCPAHLSPPGVSGAVGGRCFGKTGSVIA